MRLVVQFLSHLDELLQLGAVLQLGVTVEQQCGVVCVGQRLSVQRLQIRCEVVDPLCVQEFPDDVRRLQFPDRAVKKNTVTDAAVEHGTYQDKKDVQ